MKFPGFPSKPRWLSKDATTRRAAITHDAQPELVANLGRLAREDADPDVRIAALKRLADPGVAQGMARDDADASVRVQARALWLDLLVGSHASAPPLAERLRLLKAQDDNELIERTARHAREPELRRAALERITRPALLLERAGDDADAGIRLALVERIEDEALLERLAERARKTDKQLNRRARERIDVLRIARGDGAALEQRARQLCEALERLLREPGHGDAEAQIIAQWNAIEASVAEALRTRFCKARELLEASRNPPAPKPADMPEALVAAEEEPATEAAADVPPADAEADVAALIAQARFAASVDEANAAQRQQREQQRALLVELEQALRAFDAAVDAGASARAHAAKSHIDGLRRRIEAPLPRALAQHANATEKRYAELSQWQHWADNQRRVQICEDIEAIPAAGLHPDAVASRVRDAQTEWTRLEAAEGRDANRSGGLSRRFHAACRAALAPAQNYFRKRHELRESHAQEVHALLERANAWPDDSADWPALAALRRELVEALRGLDRVEPRERKHLAQGAKTCLGALDARIARRDEEIERAKAALIVEAEGLGQAAQRGAAAAARQLQQRWQQLGNGKRSRDQAQWKAFRAAIDVVFGKLDAERAERTARDAQARAQAEAVCVELETLAASDAADRAAVARLHAAWAASRVRDEALEQRFEQASAALRNAEKQRERTLRHARFEAWRARYTLCRAAETGRTPAGELRERWAAATPTDIAADALERRFEAALASSAAPIQDSDVARDVLIELDMLGGQESPPADGERRRALQVDRLADRLRGSSATTPAQELATLLARWSELGAADGHEADARLDRALSAVLSKLH